MTTPKYVIWDTSGVKFICPVSCPGPTPMVILQILARMLPITVILQDLAKNVKDQVYIKQRYLTQVNKKHDNLENVLIYCQKKKLILLFIGAVRCVSRFANRSYLLLCGDIEKILDPLMLENFLLWMMLYLALKMALNFYFSTLAAYKISIKIYQTRFSSWIRKLLL